MRRRRFQKGSLQQRRRGKAKRWVCLYYDAEGHRRYETLGPGTLTKSEADQLRVDFMATINTVTEEGSAVTCLKWFVEEKYLPFQRGRWKSSTAGTTENRIQYHIVKELGGVAMETVTLTTLQEYLEGKAATLSFSVVDHLRWDLKSIFDMAIAERLLTVNPAATLYTPKTAKRKPKRVMTAADVQTAIAAVEPREQAVLCLAILVGLRPGELLGLQRRHVATNCGTVEVQQRVYRGEIDDPKTLGSVRTVAVGPRSAKVLSEWMESAVERHPEAYVFAGESGRPLWRDTLLYDHIRAKLKPHGLEWVDFQVMRRTHGSLGHKIDPKVMADQRGHGIGVAVDVYTESSIGDKAAAVRKLEEKVFGKPKVVRMPKKKAS